MGEKRNLAKNVQGWGKLESFPECIMGLAEDFCNPAGLQMNIVFQVMAKDIVMIHKEPRIVES